MLRDIYLNSMMHIFFPVFWKAEGENVLPVSICISDALCYLQVDLGNIL